jgi:hypothetical protein
VFKPPKLHNPAQHTVSIPSVTGQTGSANPGAGWNPQHRPQSTYQAVPFDTTDEGKNDVETRVDFNQFAHNRGNGGKSF